MINAGQGYVEVPLSAFLGLYTEASPESLPEGASPLCWDVDFNIGGVGMRPGKQSAFAFSGADTGPNGCNSGTAPLTGLAPWANPGNITLDDGSFASVIPASPSLGPANIATTGSDGPDWANPANVSSSVSYASVTVVARSNSSVLEGTNFLFTLPTGMPVFGVQISFGAYCSDPSMGALVVSLIQNGVAIGNPKTLTLTETPTTYTLGGASDNWGTTLTTDDVDMATWGVSISALNGYTRFTAITFDVNNVLAQIAYTGSSSDPLLAKQFGFSLPNLAITGIQIGVTGYMVGTGTLTAQLLQAGVPVGSVKTFTLPSTSGRVVLGSGTDIWGTMLLYSDINNTGFGVQIQAFGASGVEQFIDYVDCTVYQTTGAQNFNWFETFEQQTIGQVSTLVLDSTGVLWNENVTSDPGVLSTIFTGITPNSFAQGITLDDVEYIAISDLLAGSDMPRQWNGTTLNRVSQVGPGAAPSVTFTATSYAELASPLGITQPPAVANTSSGVPIRAILWSSGVGVKHSPGNVITIYYGLGPTTADPNIQAGLGVQLTNFDTVNGVNPNLTYIVTSVGVQPAGLFGSAINYFTVTAASSQYSFTTPPTGAAYQATLATVTTAVPVPNVQVGNQISLSGNATAAWNQVWTVLFTPNGAQLSITATSLTSNVATYDFTLITGTAPSAGELVTVINTANGDGIFNVVNGVIQSATGSSFTVDIISPNIGSAAETGSAIVNGTEFQFDPAPLYVNTGTSAILGNDGGGTLSVAGNLGAGTRECVVMFLSESGYLGQPSPFVSFTLPNNASSITVTNLPTGPPDTVARVVAFTGAQGGFFFWIPTPVTVLDNGQNITYSATIINDNVTTQATFTLTDAVLLAATSIDIQGSNNFEQKELGPSLGCIAYADRMFYWGELNKITNFLNLSFDGGYITTPGAPTYPLGWTVDPVNGIDGDLQVSPLFGNSYLITNSTGGTAAVLGLISQTAFQDQYNVAILSPQTTYSVRIAARTPSSATVGVLTIDLYSPSFNVVYGTASFPTSAMTSTMALFSSTLLTTEFATQLPSDLVLRLYFKNSASNESVEIDRLDIFPTEEPVLTTQLTASYVNNFEAFDQVTGIVDTSVENQQPVRACFTLFDELYMVKTNSMFSTQDNGTTEPEGWQIREISKICGTPSVNGVDSGEDWAIIAARTGPYGFNGGEPTPLGPEIRSLWNLINWKYGYTLWVCNDTVNRRIVFGVPLPTPNQWLPDAPVNSNPTTPNVCLALNYVDVNGISELIDESLRVSSFTGKLLSRDKARKWTIWNIQAPYVNLIERQNGNAPMFLGNSMATGKVYQLVEGSTNDDGAAINEFYSTYGWVTPETGQALQLGTVRKGYYLMRGVVTGSGTLSVTTQPEKLVSPLENTLTYQIPSLTGDLEMPLNETATRLFTQFSMDAVGESFNLSQLVMVMQKATFAPVRGVN